VVAHDAWLLDQRFHTTEARCDCGDARAVNDAARRLAPAAHDEADDSPEPAHLGRRDGMIWMRFQARIVDTLDGRMRRERAGHGEPGRVLPLDTQSERLYPATDERCGMGIADAAEHVPQIADQGHQRGAA
jgi:hypothetical protein